MIRALHSGDEEQLEAFLVRHADFSMFLRSNSRAAGLVYVGEPLQAEYVAAFDGDQIVAVAAHCWNNVLLLQAPVDVAAVARAATEQSRRPVAGISGPAAQVTAARTALGLDDRLRRNSAAKSSSPSISPISSFRSRSPTAAGPVAIHDPTSSAFSSTGGWTTPVKHCNSPTRPGCAANASRS